MKSPLLCLALCWSCLSWNPVAVEGAPAGARDFGNWNSPTLAVGAERLADEADALQRVFRDQFRTARNYGELRQTAGRVERSARRIARWSRGDREACQIAEELNEIEASLYRLDVLVSEARLRAASGVDRPLVGCTLHVDGRMHRMHNIASCLRAELVAGSLGGRRLSYPRPATPLVPGSPFQPFGREEFAPSFAPGQLEPVGHSTNFGSRGISGAAWSSPNGNWGPALGGFPITCDGTRLTGPPRAGYRR